MGNTVTGEKIQLKRVRLSFPTLAKPGTPKGYDNSDPKFSCSFIFDPKDPAHRDQIKKLNAETQRLIKEQWGEAPPKLEFDCWGKGETFRNRQTKKPYDGYEGMYVLQANNKRRPTLVDRDKTQLTPEEVEKRLYAGCYVDAIINFWVQDNKHGEAIRCSLGAVRFREDGEEFGAGAVSADEFDDLDDGEIDDLDDFDDDIPF